MLNGLITYVFGISFFVSSVFLTADTAGVKEINAGEVYNDSQSGEVDSPGAGVTEGSETSGNESKGKMNVYFCGCYGDEWKQPVGEPIHEMCPICGMGTKATGCGVLLKTE